MSRWFWAAFTDAYEWVALPNVAGMATWGDGGVIASKPCVSTGQYIQRMGNHGGSCRYAPKQRTGERACPFTLLHWDVLDRHRARFAQHPRLGMMVRNLKRVPEAELVQIRREAAGFRKRVTAPAV